MITVEQKLDRSGFCMFTHTTSVLQVSLVWNLCSWNVKSWAVPDSAIQGQATLEHFQPCLAIIALDMAIRLAAFYTPGSSASNVFTFLIKSYRCHRPSKKAGLKGT